MNDLDIKEIRAHLGVTRILPKAQLEPHQVFPYQKQNEARR